MSQNPKNEQNINPSAADGTEEIPQETAAADEQKTNTSPEEKQALDSPEESKHETQDTHPEETVDSGEEDAEKPTSTPEESQTHGEPSPEEPATEEDFSSANEGDGEKQTEDTDSPDEDTPKEDDGPLVVGVRFQPAGRVYDYAVGAVTDLKKGDAVIVEVDRAQAYTTVVVPPRHKVIPNDQRLARILRKATQRDDDIQQGLREREKEAKLVAEETIRRHDLPMKLIRVEYLHSQNKAVFYFVTEKRVDFRELVRDLAGQLRIRIEMRQVGIRDEAKIVGGLGPCGLQTCCSHWLVDFRPVSIKQAKEQNLSLNPQKVSGLCGRLMCCLEYESQQYRDMQAGLPKVGKKADTWMGRGRIMEINIFHNTMRLELDNGQFVVIALEDFRAWKENPDEFSETLKVREEEERRRSLEQNLSNFGMNGQSSPLAKNDRSDNDNKNSRRSSGGPSGKEERESSRSRGGRRRGRGRPNNEGQGNTTEGKGPKDAQGDSRGPRPNDRRPRRPRRDDKQGGEKKEGGLIISAQTQSGTEGGEGKGNKQGGEKEQSSQPRNNRRRRPRGGRGRGGQGPNPNKQGQSPQGNQGGDDQGAKQDSSKQSKPRTPGSPTGRRRKPRGGKPGGPRNNAAPKDGGTGKEGNPKANPKPQSNQSGSGGE